MFSVNPAVGSVTQLHVATQEVFELETGGEPTRIARLHDRYLVTLRSERALALVDEAEGEPALVTTAFLGAEPFGVLADEQNDRVYVSLSQESRVVELDGHTLEVQRSFLVDDEPCWMAISPDGSSLFVASAFDARLSHINLLEGSVERLALPEILSTGMASSDVVELIPRLTGDPAISPDGRTLAIPMLWVDTFVPPDQTEGSNGVLEFYYGTPNARSMPEDELSRFNGAVLVVPLSGDGPQMQEAQVQLIAGDVQLAVTETRRVRGYPNSVTFSPDGETILVASEGSRTVSTIALYRNWRGRSWGEEDELGRLDTGELRGPESLVDSRFADNGVALKGTHGMPQAVVFLEGTEEVWVTSGLTHTAERFDYLGARNRVDGLHSVGISLPIGPPSATPPVGTSSLSLPPGVGLGRVKFYSAVDRSMSNGHSGVSCATCHFDGRTDGLTWTREGVGHQTPSLAGKVSDTEPFTWFDEVPTVVDEVLETAQNRMLGVDLTQTDAEAVAAFIDWTRAVDHPDKGIESPSVVRGRLLFEREEVGCASCHPAPTYSDGESHAVFGVEGVDTPSLSGVAATAPYLHGGQLPSLKAVLEAARSGEMGNTGELSEAQMADLEAFLRSL